MRSRPLAGQAACVALCAAAALALPAGCKTSTASETASAAPATTAAEAARQAAAAMDGGAIATAPAPDGAPADAGTSAGLTLTDAQIAAVAVTANKVDIEAGQVARQRSRNAKVRQFASTMIRAHGSANEQATALAKRLGLTLEESEISRTIAQDGKDNLSRLKGLRKKAFDKAYAEHEVTYHQQIQGALDDKLIPAARNPDLKSLLQTVRQVVATHLEHASELYDSL